jgi:aldehyde:ferredoxin oxidoreductase
MFGYMGKILRVNLSSGKISTEEIDPQTAQNFIGGSGFATKILYDEVPPKEQVGLHDRARNRHPFPDLRTICGCR